MKLRPTVLLYAQSPSGGLAEHLHYQAIELLHKGIHVICVCTPSFLRDGRTIPYDVRRVLLDDPRDSTQTLVAKIRLASIRIVNQYRLALFIIRERQDLVLLEATTELLAPFWVWPHLLLRYCLGIKYAANVHDPVRYRAWGHQWWHRLSVWLSYLPIEIGLIHHDSIIHRSELPRHINVVPVPYGCYARDGIAADRARIRTRFGVANSSSVFLSFGYIADRKNLDLFIRAMPGFPQVVLIAVGQRASRRDRPASFYQALAREFGVADRVHVIEGFVANSEVADYFAAADVVLLTYNRKFVSQSGVLLVAAEWQKPVLASSGPGPLREAVARFQLGPVVEPDSVEALKGGLQKLLSNHQTLPNWSEFVKQESWERNVEALLKAANLSCVSSRES